MRRSRALLLFGGFLAVLTVATVSVRSHAAGRASASRAGIIGADGVVSSQTGWRLDLLPLLAKRDEAVFGSFIKSRTVWDTLPSDTGCPPEMVEVEGDYCPYVDQKCLRWLDPTTKLQCAEFERSPTPGRCSLSTEHKRLCMDRYEWPNKVGVLPTYMANWYEAKSSCEAIGKRLCSDTEWTLACEGPERQPYPYGDGYLRDDRACNVDKPYIWPNPEKFVDPRMQAEEVARLDQREASGARTSCVSPYGVHDMTGNVDEWVLNVSQFGKPYLSGLKGGYWGPVRTRCRPMTTAHEEAFRYYQIGFRCCGDAHSGNVGEAPVAKL